MRWPAVRLPRPGRAGVARGLAVVMLVAGVGLMSAALWGWLGWPAAAAFVAVSLMAAGINEVLG